MTKKVIRLTESDLHNMVKDSIKRVLKESESIDDVFTFDEPIVYDLGNGKEYKTQTIRDIENGIAVGTIDHTHKKVSPAHGYFIPNQIGFNLKVYAKMIGYEYAHDSNWESLKKQGWS